MADIEFKVAKRRKRTITFTLEGDDYEYAFIAPKQAGLFMPYLTGDANGGDMLMVKGVFDWLGNGLHTEGDVQRIIDRMKDPDDDLDFDTLNEVITQLTETIGARPTT